MPLDHTAIIKQIDDILSKYDPNNPHASIINRALSMMLSALSRLSPPGSVYANSVQRYEPSLAASYLQMCSAVEQVRGMLGALRSDYESGYLESVVELVHADIFADFLEMADYLLQQGYKDPAAVVGGSVLEAHLRKLCDKHGIPVIKPDGSPKAANTLNSELAGANVYSKLDLKSVTAWQDLRNQAAHGKYTEYTMGQVTVMLQWVRDFASRYPA
jgi:hypothetical protein